ncbi:PREDICTED: monocarboxylate transporter 1-like [Papilio polytes]|uniref:monocarboxylate transporter 1-like n=1 Tax=Papilio polytes TaxID=76194 RepID=UPI000676320B|nr:PREDICTED: monocarboxylate transporter 1-like [Papilio polytes]
MVTGGRVEKNKLKIKETEDVADNNIWGYVVCFGTIITFIAGIGHVNSFGLIYNDFIIETNSTAKSLTTAHGVFAIMLAIGGLLLNMIIKKRSLRFGGLLGAFTFSVGSLLTILITNTNQLPLTFGVLQGIGFGMMVPVCYSTLNYYYVKRRTQVMSVIKALQGFILMWYPQLIKLFMTEYGFRGTLLIISGISLHGVPGMAVMRSKPPRNFRTAKDAKNVGEQEDLLNVENGKLNTEKEKEHQKDKRKLSVVRHELWKSMNIKVLKDPVFCNICVGQSFVNFSDLTFFILLPMLLFQYGYTATQVATCISITAAADVAGRCILAVISSIVDINTRLLYYIATAVTLIVRIVMLQVREFVYVAVVTGILGVLRAWLHVASPLVIASQVPHGDFPGAYALSMLAAGIVNLASAPFIGLLKDVYQDYVPAFYALAACCAPCLIFWPIEYVMTKQ